MSIFTRYIKAPLSIGFIAVVLLCVPQKSAEAIPVFDEPAFFQRQASFISQNVSVASQLTTDTWHTVLRTTANAAVYAMAQGMLNQITENLISWIRNDFEGSPTFNINPKRLFEDMAFFIAGDLYNDLRGIAMCDFSGFQLQLARSLYLAPTPDKQIERNFRCPFDEVITTCDALGCRQERVSPSEQARRFSQSFVDGGWGAFEKMLQDAGNQVGLAYVTQEEYYRRLAEAENIQTQELAQNQGYINLIDRSSCQFPSDLDVSNLTWMERTAAERQYCGVKTPGSLIGAQLNQATGIDMERLGFVDSIDKVVTAFVQQLTKNAIEGVYSVVFPAGGRDPQSGLWSTGEPYFEEQEFCLDDAENIALSKMTEAQSMEVVTLLEGSPVVSRYNQELAYYRDELAAERISEEDFYAYESDLNFQKSQYISEEIQRASTAFMQSAIMEEKQKCLLVPFKDFMIEDLGPAGI